MFKNSVKVHVKHNFEYYELKINITLENFHNQKCLNLPIIYYPTHILYLK